MNCLIISTRPAQPGEGSILAAIRRDAILGDCRSDLSPEFRKAWAYTAEHQATAEAIDKWITDTTHLILVPANTPPVAYIHVDLALGLIKALFVKTNYSRKGIATQLLAHALTHQKAKNINEWLVYSTQQAKNIYLKDGFYCEKTCLAPLSGGFFLPGFVMRKVTKTRSENRPQTSDKAYI